MRSLLCYVIMRLGRSKLIPPLPGAGYLGRGNHAGLVCASSFDAWRTFPYRLMLARFLRWSSHPGGSQPWLRTSPVAAAIGTFIYVVTPLCSTSCDNVGDSPVRDTSGIPLLIRRSLRTANLDGLQFMAGNVRERKDGDVRARPMKEPEKSIMGCTSFSARDCRLVPGPCQAQGGINKESKRDRSLAVSVRVDSFRCA